MMRQHERAGFLGRQSVHPLRRDLWARGNVAPFFFAYCRRGNSRKMSVARQAENRSVLAFSAAIASIRCGIIGSSAAHEAKTARVIP